MRWRIIALLFVARIGLGFQFHTVASGGDGLVEAFGLDYAGIGLLIGLFMAPGLVLSLPAGYWGRFISDRMMVVFGLSAMAFGGLASSLASESWAIGAGRILAGTGSLFSMLYFAKMIADWFEGREIATAMSILVMSWPFWHCHRTGVPRLAGGDLRLANPFPSCFCLLSDRSSRCSFLLQTTA